MTTAGVQAGAVGFLSPPCSPGLTYFEVSISLKNHGVTSRSAGPWGGKEIIISSKNRVAH